MATDTIPARGADVNLAREIDDRATELQVLAHRVSSLAQATINATDNIECSGHDELHRSSVGSVIDFAELIKQKAQTIIAKGEMIEIMSRDVEPRREAGQ